MFQMEHNKAPGPDGFPAEFYQVFWEVIKKDLLALFFDFYEEKLPLFCLNFGVISLIPKANDAKKIQQYRPICVLNVSFKIFTKVGTNRINSGAIGHTTFTDSIYTREEYHGGCSYST